MKYRRRPLEVEAFQLAKENHGKRVLWPRWARCYCDSVVYAGDWLIKEQVVEMLSDDLFRKEYEPVEETPDDPAT